MHIASVRDFTVEKKVCLWEFVPDLSYLIERGRSGISIVGRFFSA